MINITVSATIVAWHADVRRSGLQRQHRHFFHSPTKSTMKQRNLEKELVLKHKISWKEARDLLNDSKRQLGETASPDELAARASAIHEDSLPTIAVNQAKPEPKPEAKPEPVLEGENPEETDPIEGGGKDEVESPVVEEPIKEAEVGVVSNVRVQEVKHENPPIVYEAESKDWSNNTSPSMCGAMDCFG